MASQLLNSPPVYPGANLVWGNEYLKLPLPEIPYLIDPILPKGGLMNIYADPKVGKSLLALQLCSAISTPECSEILNFPVVGHGPTAYVQVDNPASTWRPIKVKALAEEGYPIDGVGFADRDLPPEYQVPFPFIVAEVGGSPGAGFFWLRDCARKNPQVVTWVIDTLREVHLMNEDRSLDMKLVLDLLTYAVYPAALILISHARKPTEFGDSLIASNRGSSYIPGKMDTIIKLTAFTMKWISRTTSGEAMMQLRRTDNGLWIYEPNENHIIAERYLEDNKGMPIREIARKWASDEGHPEDVERYRKRLQRSRTER